MVEAVDDAKLMTVGIVMVVNVFVAVAATEVMRWVSDVEVDDVEGTVETELVLVDSSDDEEEVITTGRLV